ncbi:MAG: LD-carboxypeptidase [Acidobacteria bacterium]|nr:LD-carboxypeptidase [Acidobacteriota bacterium]
MNIPTIHPPRLKKGDSVAIVAPAGPVPGSEGLEEGVAILEKMGFRVHYSERIFQSARYLAGDDTSRGDELLQAFEDDSIRAVVGLRGGYGCARLVPRIMAMRRPERAKIFMGFSDLTTLHLLLNRHLGWITLHGPMAMTLGRGAPSQGMESHLLSLLTDPAYRPALRFPQLETWKPGTAEGVLTGGCLSIITASIGTSYEIDTKGKILFLEDLGEPPYRLDRMITQLRLCGKLESVEGVLLGSFHDCDPEEGDYSARDVLKEMLEELHVPVLANFPAGHGPENWPLPLGARIRMDAGARSVELLEAAVS